MNIEELRKRRALLKKNTDTTLNNMQVIADESLRVAEIANNSREIIENLDKEFERQTGLDKTDVKFLFFATALQIGRWVVINQVNKHVTEKMDTSRIKDNDPRIKKRNEHNVINLNKNMKVNGHIIKVRNTLLGLKLSMMVCLMMLV